MACVVHKTQTGGYMRKNLILAGLLLLLSVSLVFGAWINSFPMTVEQPDGQKIDCFASGDEFNNWLHDSNGYTIIQNSQTGFYVWAIRQGRGITASDFRADLTNPEQLGLEKNVNISEEEYKAKKERFFAPVRNIQSRAPSTGTLNNLVVFIRFSNDSEFNQSITPYDNMLNPLGDNANSMRHYFQEVSYQTLDVVSTYYPQPENNMIISYQDSHPRSYFLPYNANTNPNGYTQDNRAQREHTLLANAVAYIEEMVPTDMNLDGDNDDRVDNVCFVVKGSTGAWADLLWPHRWMLFGAEAYIHGKRVWDFNLQIQNHLISTGSSVLAHEMFHSLGSPDLYRYSYNGEPIGQWDLMASNTTPPQHMSAYMKYRYGFWIQDIPEITSSGTYSLKSIKSATNNCYKIASPYSPNEYFVIEFRSQQQGIFDSQLPGSGLLAYRVNGEYSGQGNASGPPDELLVFRPNGDNDGNGNVQSANLALEYNRTMINDMTEPRSFLSNGENGGLNISNIGSCLGDSITFYVNVLAPDLNDIDEDFENNVLSDFDWQNDMVHPWTIVSSGYNSNKCLKSGSIINGQTTSVMQMINCDYGFIQFWYRTSSETNYDVLNFFVDDVLMGTFSGFNDWTYVVYNVNSGLHTLRWVYSKNTTTSAGNDCVWIDRIGFPELLGNVYYPPRNLTANALNRDIQLIWNRPFVSNLYNIGNVTSYKVYCNNELIADVPASDTTYTQTGISGGNLIYLVKAVYDLNNESLPSNEAQAYLPFLAPINLTGAVFDGGVVLNWNPPAFSRSLIGYKVYRNNVSLFSGNIQNNNYVDSTVVEGTQYTYTVRALYQNPSGLSPQSNPYVVTYSANDDHLTNVPITRLKGNYPNPFNPETSISFSLAKNDVVSLMIYNTKGQLVKILYNGKMTNGDHILYWNGKDQNSQKVAGGIYFYKMKTSEYSETKKMILLK